MSCCMTMYELLNKKENKTFLLSKSIPSCQTVLSQVHVRRKQIENVTNDYNSVNSVPYFIQVMSTPSYWKESNPVFADFLSNSKFFFRI